MSHSKSLLEKYNIPIEHLDFDYVRNCVSTKEIERILEILKSGEEGHYPQLTECTEKRLRELNPDNKMFRVEHKLWQNSHPECKGVQEEVEAFVNEVRQKLVVEEADVQLDQFLPPIRQIKGKKAAHETSAHEKTDRIKSCDYDKWSKYDPDTECLKMDLHEEKIREDLLQQQGKQKKLIEVIPATNGKLIDQLTDAEKKTIADGHRLKGNECFRSADYESAIFEYTNSLKFVRTAAAFNNRAAAYIKIGKYSQAISDCDECLSIEPNNVKAMLRRAEALNVSGRGNDAYRQYARVLELEPENPIAQKSMKTIPIRLEIEDIDSGSVKKHENKESQMKTAPKLALEITSTKVNDDYDHELRKLIIPKKIVRSKLSQAVSNMKNLCPKKLPNKIKK